jgi:hypothetical protein
MAPVFYFVWILMPQNVLIVLFTYIIVSNDTIQVQISRVKQYGTDMFTLFYTSLWEDSHQDKARAKCWSCNNNSNNNKYGNPQLIAS